jgi:hypothetical protein
MFSYRPLPHIAALAGTALAASVLACGDDDATYVERNEALLEELPVPPGAELVEIQSSPYYDERAGPEPVGYTTNAIYSPPEGWDAERVLDFYGAELGDEWRRTEETSPIVDIASGETTGSVAVLLLDDDPAQVSVNPDNMESSPPTFEVSVDSGGG